MNDDYWGWGREIVGRGLVEQNPFWLLYTLRTNLKKCPVCNRGSKFVQVCSVLVAKL